MAVEEREFDGNREQFYVLELSRGGTVLLPTKSMPEEAFRRLISAAKATALLKRMRSKKSPKTDPSLDSKGRARLYSEQLKGGDADQYTEILRDLMYREANEGLSTTEQRLLEHARAYFVEEVASVLKRDPKKVLAEIEVAIEKLRAADK